MDLTCPRNTTLLMSIPASQASAGPLSQFVGLAHKIGGIFASLNVNLDRKTTIVPGLSDRAIARLSAGQRYEYVARWNALAHQYGGTRIRQ